MSGLKKLRLALKTDDVWRSYRNIVNSAYDPQFDNLIEELLRMHKSRGIRVLRSSAGARKISDAGLQDQSYRSRAVEIYVTILTKKNLLTAATDKVSVYTMSEYSNVLMAAGYKTKVGQRAAIELLTSRANETLQKMDTIQQVAIEIIEDLDKAAWTIKNCLTALEIRTKREFAT